MQEITVKGDGPRQGCVYLLTNLVNGKRYIGQDGSCAPENHRWKSHIKAAFDRGSQYPLHRAIRKYDVKNFSAEVIWHGPVEAMNKMEVHYIKKLHTFIDDPLGDESYNLTTGGGQGVKVPNRTRKLLTNALLHRWSNPEEHKKRSAQYSGENNPFYGKRHSAETVAVIRAKLRVAMRGSGNPFYGKRHSAETVELIREKATGVNPSEATRKKMSVARLGRKLTFEHCQHISQGWRNRTTPTKAKGVAKSVEHNRRVAEARRGSKLIDGHYVNFTIEDVLR